jgi:hypothetical protein
VEFEYVLRAAPDNLTATRELADIQQRRRAHSPVAAMSNRAMPASPLQTPIDHQLPATDHQPDIDPVIAELEAWLAVLADERVARPARI